LYSIYESFRNGRHRSTKHEGADAYRESCEEWQPDTAGPGVDLFELEELEITAGSEVAFAYGIIHCGGRLPDGKTFVARSAAQARRHHRRVGEIGTRRRRPARC
jgi:ketosteroid isomerase-like protein